MPFPLICYDIVDLSSMVATIENNFLLGCQLTLDLFGKQRSLVSIEYFCLVS